jgi:hypothetical protein
MGGHHDSAATERANAPPRLVTHRPAQATDDRLPNSTTLSGLPALAFKRTGGTAYVHTDPVSAVMIDVHPDDIAVATELQVWHLRIPGKYRSRDAAQVAYRMAAGTR